MAKSRSRTRGTAGSTRGRKGPATFQEAVAEGLKLFSQTGTTAQRRVRDAVDAAQETLQGRVGGAREQAQETWDNLEALFQSRVQRAMHQLGVPTAAEIRELSRRVAELNDTVMDARQPRRAAQEAGQGQGGARRAAKAAPGAPRPSAAARQAD